MSATIQKEGKLSMKKIRTALAATLAVAVLAAMAVQPAKADGAASTRNIILGAAALAAGIVIESNVAHKHRLANTIQGYLPDGSIVYEDGRVVLPNGQSYYPGNYGQTIACSNQVCYISGGNGNGPYYGNAPYYGNNGSGYGYASNGNYVNAPCNSRGQRNGQYNGSTAYGNDSYAWQRYRASR